MKALALFILAITAIAQAMPNGQHGSKQDMVKGYGSPNGLGSSVGLNSGESDSQLGVNKAKHDTPRGFLTIVGADGVVNTAYAHMLPAASPTGGLEADDANSNGRQDGQQDGTRSQRKGQGLNGHLDRPQSNRQKRPLRFGGGGSNELQITFVTVTIKPTAARVSGGAGTKLPGTVTTTITVSRSAQTGGKLTPNADGNGVGVTTIPIDKSALPTTTHSLNPSGPPPLAPPKPSSSSSLPPVPAPAAPAKSSQSAVPVHDSHLGNGTSLPSSSTSSLVRQASTTLSSGSSKLGGQAPPPTAPLESPTAPSESPTSPLESPTAPAATTIPGVVAPAQPVVNLSGVTLNSILDLGNLAKQTGQAPATTAVAF